MVKTADFRPRFARKNPQLRLCEVIAACPECARYDPANQRKGMMPRTRLLAAAAAFSIMTLAGAAAQTATNTTPGNPMPLLKILAQPETARTKVHGKRVGRRMGKTHIAAKTKAFHRSATARRALPAPADEAAVPVNVPAAPSAAASAPSAALSVPSAAPPALSFAEPIPNELVIGGRTVQVTSPDHVNEIDKGADAPSVSATAASAAMQSDIAEVQPAAETVTVAPVPPDASPVGSASWIMQILAALGGAFAAGSAAWFLIGSAPQRTYG
jgi:hypothetical protein